MRWLSFRGLWRCLVVTILGVLAVPIGAYAQPCEVTWISDGSPDDAPLWKFIPRGDFIFAVGMNYVQVWDHSDPEAPFMAGQTPNLMFTCGDSSHVVKDFTLFPNDGILFEATECLGIKMFDIGTDPVHPSEKATVNRNNVSPIATLVMGNGTRYLVFPSAGGLAYVDCTDPNTPGDILTYSGINRLADTAFGFNYSGKVYLAIMTQSSTGFALYDVTNFPASTTMIVEDIQLRGQGAFHRNGKIYVMGRQGVGINWGMRVFSVQTGALLGIYQDADFTQASGVAADDRYAYLALGDCPTTNGYDIVNIENPAGMYSILPVDFVPHTCATLRPYDFAAARSGAWDYSLIAGGGIMQDNKLYCGEYGDLSLEEFSPGILHPGGTVALHVTLKNTGTLEETGVTATLSATHPDVTVNSPNPQNYGSFLPGQSVSRDFSITVEPDAGPGMIAFHLDIAGSTGSYADDFIVWIEPCPGAFDLLFPADGATGLPSTLDLDWEDSAYAMRYDLYLGTTLPPPLFQAGITASQVQVSGLAGGTTFYWYVKAVNSCGAKDSRKREFTTAPPDLHYDHVLLQDSCSYGGLGNGNGIAEPGETFQLYVTLRNDGDGYAAGISGTLYATSPGVTVVSGSAMFDGIPPNGGTGSSLTPFVISIDASVPCMDTVSFILVLNGNGGPWTEVFTLQMGSPVQPIFAQAFEIWPPPGWQVQDNGGTCVWESNSTTGLSNYTGGTGWAAVADSDWCGAGSTMDTELWTPTFSLPYASCATLCLPYGSSSTVYATWPTLCQPYGSSPPVYATSATLTFRAAYRDIYGSMASLEFRGRTKRASVADEDNFSVDISQDGGMNWLNLLFWDEDHSPLGPGEQVVLDLTPFSGLTNLVLRFVYVALGWDWWAEIDDVGVEALDVCSICGPPPEDFALLSPADESTGVSLDVVLDWADSAGADCYRLYFGTVDPPPPFDVNLPSSERSVQDLFQCTLYYWRVEAVNSFRIVSASGGTWRFQTTGSLATPTNVTATGVCAGVTVGWDPVSGATSYNVYRGTACGTETAIFIDVVSPYTDASAVPGIPHQYWVEAVSTACGTSDISACATGMRVPAPDAPATGNDGPTCAGQTLNFTASTVSDAAYSWTGPNGFTSNLQNPSIPNAATAASGIYNVTVTVNGCTSTAGSTSAIVNPLPAPTISGFSSNTCPEVSLTLATESGMNGYQWYWNGSPIPGATGSTHSAAQSGDYRVSCTDTNGCTGISALKTVSIVPCSVQVQYDGAFSPPSTLVQICGDGDGIVEPGEQWQVTVGLVNTGDGHATNTSAVLAVNAGSGVAAVITGNPGLFGTVPADGGTATADYRFLVDGGATCVNDLIFDVTNIQSTEGTYPGRIPAFSVPVGFSSSQNEVADQQTSPLNASNTTVNSSLTPAFTIIAPPDTATLSYASSYSQKPAQDVVLFGPDDFATLDNWNSTGGSLTTEAKCASSTPVPSNAYYMISQNANITLKNAVSTVGHTNIRVSFHAAVQTTGAWIYLDWSPDGATWNNGVWSTNSLSWQCDRTVALPVGAEGQAGFKIRFRDTGSAANQRGKVDYVKIVGTSPAAGNWTANARVSLVDPSDTVTVLKAYGAADASPYDVKPYYTEPGTYQIRLEENIGGTATLFSAQMAVDKTIAQCDVSACTGTTAPPPVNNIGADAAKFTKNPDGDTLRVTYDAVTCNAQKAILLYGNLGSWTGYSGCGDGDLGNGGQDDGADAAGLNNVWFNIVWTNGATAGHPGFAFDGTADIPRTWTVGTLCGITADDLSHASCP